MRIFSFKELIDVLKSHGWRDERKTGSHVILTKEGNPNSLAVSFNKTKKNLKPPTVMKILRKAGIKSEGLK
jgi:predicted RNA binding protein YcfA (HicA-like mRNA interferase family)